MKILFGICLFLVLVACDSNESISETEEIHSEVDTLSFSVVDTIGVLVGDPIREFGSIPDIDISHNGNIMVLDAMKGQITVFSQLGEFVEIIGRHGSAPGEFQYPTGFAELTDGRIVVADFAGASLSFFDENHTFTHTLDGFYPVPPLFPSPGPDGNYYAGSMTFRANEDSPIPEGESFLGLYGNETEPEIVLFSHPLDISIGDDGDVNVDNTMAYWDTDSEGNVFWAVSDDSTYVIIGMNALGEEILKIEKDWERIEKTEEELAQEIFTEGLSRTDEGESTVNRNQIVNPYPYHLAISGMYLDMQDRIWVQQGYPSVPTFEVYSTDGELLNIVTIPTLEGVTQLGFCFKGGSLAFDIAPEDYPKIYLLEFEL